LILQTSAMVVALKRSIKVRSTSSITPETWQASSLPHVLFLKSKDPLGEDALKQV